jgi:hypothetical protein
MPSPGGDDHPAEHGKLGKALEHGGAGVALESPTPLDALLHSRGSECHHSPWRSTRWKADCPLGDSAGLFRHWRDTTNAERMNY